MGVLFSLRVENEQAWKVSIDEVIARNFNLDIKNPHVGETISHDPDELLASYRQQQQELEGLLGRLQATLEDALINRQ